VFGLVTRCELRSDGDARFDELVEDLLRSARQEPAGLIAYSCHRVSGKPDSRVVFELYADHLAFVEFGQRPDIRRIVDEQDVFLLRPRRVDFLEDPVGGSLLYFGNL